MTAPTVDDIAAILLPAARTELNQLMGEVKPIDLTAMEVVTMLTVLRGAHERVRPASPPVQLSLVRPKRKRRSANRTARQTRPLPIASGHAREPVPGRRVTDYR
jgi:hypothetical protein